MGCGSSKPIAKPQRRQGDDPPPIDPIDVPEWDPNYPPPGPPSEEKETFFDERNYGDKDEEAASVKGDFDSYESLLDVLTIGCETYVDTARAIFVWLFNQDIFNTSYNGVTDPNTPRGYMKLIKTGKGTYEAFFALLCRAANIPCAILHGFGKGEKYLVGQTETEGLESTWNAIYIKKSWRLVHLDWAYHEEKICHSGTNTNRGTKLKSINEFFWLTDPPKMIRFCHPNENQWQLLNSPWELAMFLQSPQQTEEYFTSGLKIPRGYKAITESKHGVCSIKFEHNKKDASKLKISGRLKRENDNTNNVDTNNFIITTGTESSKELFIRFPETGIYYLDVSGGHEKQNPVIAKFRLDCTEVGNLVHPFPFQPDDGFMVLPEVQDFQIVSLRPTNGVVYVKPRSIKEFQFSLSRDLDIQAKMFHVNKALGTLDQFIEVVKKGEGGQVWVKIAIPEDRHVEYALQISALDPALEDESYTPIANYLLVHNSWPHPPTRVKSAAVVHGEDEARRRLQEATKSGDMTRLEDAIKEFKASGLEDEGDFTKALNVLLSMHLNNLRAASEARDLKQIAGAIVQAQKSCLADIIEPTEEMEEAHLVQRQLLRLKLVLHKVMELKPRTISEIHSYPRPRPLVHDVMKATYRILGEPHENVKSWQEVRNLTKQIGLNGIINRIKRFDIIFLSSKEVDDAQMYLNKTDSYDVRLVSAGAGTFYAWSKSILSQYKTMSQEMRERKGTRLGFV